MDQACVTGINFVTILEALIKKGKLGEKVLLTKTVCNFRVSGPNEYQSRERLTSLWHACAPSHDSVTEIWSS